MLILRFKRNKNFEDVVRRKIRRNYVYTVLTMFFSEDIVIIVSQEFALSIALLYSIYLEAKEKGLEPEILYAIRVDPEKLIPEELRKLGEQWRRRKLKNTEKNKYSTELIIDKLLENLPYAEILVER